MADRYDVIAIGSGHNGLVAAAYLATAGKKVLVLERQTWFGGGVTTGEWVAPGFKNDRHSMAHIFIQGNPLIRNDELGLLSKYGLKYVYPEVPFMSVFDDGTTLGLTTDRQRNYEDIAKFSKKDAESYLQMAETGAKYLPMLMSSFYTPPVPMGASMAMLDQSHEGRELFRIMQRSCYDVVTEYYEHEKVRMHFMRLVCENLDAPDDRGTGLGLFVFAGFVEKFGMGVPVGGSGALSEALIRCIQDKGGTVEGGVEVTKVVVKNGRATGVRTADGREIAAKDAIIGAIHPHDLGRIVEGVEPRVAAAAARTKLSEIGCIVIHAALHEPLQFVAGDAPRKGYMIELVPPEPNKLRRYFDMLRYGEIPSYSMIGIGTATNFDPSRAPPGKATVQIWDYVPYEHPDGGHARWDDPAVQEERVDVMLERMKPYLKNMTRENMVAYKVDTPVDMERTSASFKKGDIHGVAPLSYQQGSHRPTPDLGNNRVPGVAGLYLVGPFQHPGGGVFGAGRASAMLACQDLKIDFDKIGRKK